MITFEPGNFLYFEGLMERQKDYCFVLKVMDCNVDLKGYKSYTFLWEDGTLQTIALSHIMLSKFTKVF